MNVNKWIGLWLLASLTVACVASPTGRRQLLLYQDAEVAQLGLASFDEMKKQEKIATDPALNRYVGCVAEAVTRQIPAHYQTGAAAWEVVLFDSPQINAFALPGGRIGVYTGLLKVAKDQDQLAAVLGHEVAHVLAKHSNERLSNTQVANLGMVAADMALGESPVRQSAMAALGLGAQVGYLLPYGRLQESEADVLGLQLMARAGFQPEAAVSLWQNMAQATSRQPSVEFLSTHPSNERRIAQLQQQLAIVAPDFEQARALGRYPQCRG